MSQEADASGSREAQARPAEAREEETCPLCLGPPQAPTRAFPCGHSFCAACADHWPADGVECPVCRQLVGALVSIPPPAPPPPAAATARRPRRRLRRSRRQRERSPRERSPHRSRSVSPRRAQRSPSRRPLWLVRGLYWHQRDADDAEDWPRLVRERQWGSGDRDRRGDAEDDEDWLRLVRERGWGSGDHERGRDGPRGRDEPCG